MRYLLVLSLLFPLISFAQSRVDTTSAPGGACIRAVTVSTQSGVLILSREQDKFILTYKTDNYVDSKKSRDLTLKIKGVTFHFLDRTLISFKCNGIGKAPRALSLTTQYNALKFSAVLTAEEFKRLTSKKITTFSVIGENGSTGGDVIFGGFRQDIIDSYNFLAGRESETL